MTDTPATAEGPPRLLDFKQERIRVLHYTWIAFLLTFYVWFNMAPLATTMVTTLGWLTPEHLKLLIIANLALTIPARIVIGALVDRFGARVVFSGLMVVLSVPAIAFAFGNSFTQLLIARLVVGSVGAGFVVGIKMVSQWFPPKYVGRAEGFYAGWGNFGSAAAAWTLPFVALTVLTQWIGMTTESGWRWAMALSGIVMGIYGVIYFFVVRDVPKGTTLLKADKTEPMRCTSYGDLIQYIVWSFPLVGALGLMAWRIGNVHADGKAVLSPAALYVIYGVLALVYVAHVAKILHVNLPYLKKGVPEHEKYHWGSVAALNSTYFANFGAELAVVSMLPMFFEATFKPLTNGAGQPIVTATVAGLLAGSFAFVNLFARPLGGYISDRMANRKRTMLVYMIGIAIGFLFMAFIGKPGGVSEGVTQLVPMVNSLWWVVIAVVVTILASVFVQGAEGATFAVIPMINKRMTGQIAGMAGAYGNVGAVVYTVVYSLVDARAFFFILSAGAALSFVVTLFMLEEPKDAFAETLDHDLPRENPQAGVTRSA